MSVKAQTKRACEGYQVYFLLLVEEETRSDLTTSASGSRRSARLKKLPRFCGGNSTKDTISNAEGFFACGSSSLAESLFCFQGNKIKEKDNVLCIKSAVLRFLC